MSASHLPPPFAMDPSNWSSFIFQGHAQNPLQVGAELQSRFFASQGCAQSPFQAAPAPPPTPQAPAAEPLQVDLLPVPAAALRAPQDALLPSLPPAGVRGRRGGPRAMRSARPNPAGRGRRPEPGPRAARAPGSR